MSSPKLARPQKRGAPPPLEENGGRNGHVGVEGKRVKSSSSSSIPTVHTNNGDINPQILNLGLSWLDPKDLARSSQVCKGWQKGINQHTWKQAAENVKPESLQALEKALKSKDNKLNSQAMALGLAKIHEKAHLPPPDLPDPTIKADDIFLLVELKAFNTTGAWCKSMSECLQHFGETEFVNVDFKDCVDEAFQFEIPHSELEALQSHYCEFDYTEFIPTDPGALYLFANMHLSLSLWRADTGQSYCFCSSQKHSEEAILQENGPFLVEDYFDSGCSSEAQWNLNRMGNTTAGKIARGLCAFHNYNYLDPEVNVCLKPILPLAGSKGEPEWLKELRATDNSAMEFDSFQQMEKFLAEKNFKYGVSALQSDFRFSVGDDQTSNDNVESREHFLLYLEGLAWE